MRQQMLLTYLAVALAATQVSCGAKLISAGDLRPKEKTYCSDVSIESVTVTFPATDIPPNLFVSINGGAVILDTCAPLDRTPAAKSYIAVGVMDSRHLAVNLELFKSTPIRNYYFGSDLGTSPVRSDLSVYVAQRATCASPLVPVLSDDHAFIRWQQGPNAATGCSATDTTYQGVIAY